MTIHVTEQQPQIGEALPVVPRHLPKQGTLAIDHLVMDKGSTKFSKKAYQMLKVSWL